MIKNFLKGISFALAGIKYFYSDRSLWKYILPVWGIVSLIYLLLIRLAFKGSAWLTDKILTYIRDWPEFLRVITAYTLNTTAVIVMLILVLTTFCMLFEAAGGIFFDKLTERFEQKYYRNAMPRIPLLRQAVFTAHAMWFAVKNVFLLMLLVLFTAVMLPPVGAIVTTIIMGKRMARSLIYPIGFLRGSGIMETDSNLKQRKAEVFGFGIAVYLLQLIPFSLLFTLPGLVIGAAIFYNGKLPEDLPSVESCDSKIS